MQLACGSVVHNPTHQGLVAIFKMRNCLNQSRRSPLGSWVIKRNPTHSAWVAYYLKLVKSIDRWFHHKFYTTTNSIKVIEFEFVFVTASYLKIGLTTNKNMWYLVVPHGNNHFFLTSLFFFPLIFLSPIKHPPLIFLSPIKHSSVGAKLRFLFIWGPQFWY